MKLCVTWYAVTEAFKCSVEVTQERGGGRGYGGEGIGWAAFAERALSSRLINGRHDNESEKCSSSWEINAFPLVTPTKQTRLRKDTKGSRVTSSSLIGILM